MYQLNQETKLDVQMIFNHDTGCPKNNATLDVKADISITFGINMQIMLGLTNKIKYFAIVM